MPWGIRIQDNRSTEIARATGNDPELGRSWLGALSAPEIAINVSSGAGERRP
jgi:hypothetical protein